MTAIKMAAAIAFYLAAACLAAIGAESLVLGSSHNSMLAGVVGIIAAVVVGLGAAGVAAYLYFHR